MHGCTQLLVVSDERKALATILVNGTHFLPGCSRQLDKDSPQMLPKMGASGITNEVHIDAVFVALVDIFVCICNGVCNLT